MHATLRLSALFASCFLAGVVSAQTYIGNLNGTAAASTFETGYLSNVGDSHTNLGLTVGWVELSGDTRLFLGSANTAVISTGAYTTYSVRYDTGVAVQANTTYTLSFNLGFMTQITGNTAYYRFELGTYNGTFASLAGQTYYDGQLSYNGGEGTLNLGSNNSSADSSQWTTGGTVNGDNLSVVFSLIGYGVPNASSDFFGFDNVTLTAAAIPEPSTYAAILGACALGLVAWRRRRQRSV